MLYLKKQADLLTDLFKIVNKPFHYKLHLIPQLQKLNVSEIKTMIRTINSLRDKNEYQGVPLEDSDELLLWVIYNQLYSNLDDFYYFKLFLEIPKNKNRKDLSEYSNPEFLKTISYDKLLPILDDYKSWKKDYVETLNKELDKIILLDLGI